MADKGPPLTDELYAYVLEHGIRRDETLLEVERETAALGDVAIMQTSPVQAALLELLVRALGAREAIEVGTFTGYGAIRIARGLPPDGRLLCCELREDYAATARRNVDAAGVGERVELRIGAALDTLRSLPREPRFDFAYLDADKAAYPDYYEELLPRMRSNGVLAIDNVLMFGAVLDPDARESARIVDALNRRIADDERVDAVLLPLADGLTLVRKR